MVDSRGADSPDQPVEPEASVGIFVINDVTARTLNAQVDLISGAAAVGRTGYIGLIPFGDDDDEFARHQGRNGYGQRG